MLLSLLAAGWAAPGAAQERDAPTTAPGFVDVPLTFDLAVDAAPLAEVLEAVRDRDATFNFVLFDRGVSPEKTIVPPMRLRGVTSDQVLELLAGARLGCDVVVEPMFRQDARRTYRITLHTDERQQAQQLRVFPLGAVADRLVPDTGEQADDQRKKAVEVKVQEIVDLIERARELNDADAPGAQPPKMHYHPGTGMLIMKGSPSQLWAAEEVVRAFSQSARPAGGFGGGTGGGGGSGFGTPQGGGAPGGLRHGSANRNGDDVGGASQPLLPGSATGGSGGSAGGGSGNRQPR